MEFAQWLKETFALDASALTPESLAKFQALYDQAMADEGAGDGATMTAGGDGTQTDPNAMQAHRGGAGGSPGSGAGGSAGAARSGGTDQAVDVNSVVLQAMRAETARVSRIRAMAGSQNQLAEQAISEGWEPDRFELAVMRASRSSHSGASSGGTSQNDSEVMQAALLINCGMQEARLRAHFSDEVLNRAAAREYRGFSMVECADRIRARAGVHYAGHRNQQGHMEAVSEANNRLRAAGFGTYTLSYILENVADKVLLDMYQSVETVWQQICAIRSLNDFKVHSQYALDPTNTFKKVQPRKFNAYERNPSGTASQIARPHRRQTIARSRRTEQFVTVACGPRGSVAPLALI